VRVLGFDRTGRRVCDIDERDAGYRMVTGVRAQGNTLYLGSLYESAVAVCRLFTDPAPAPACRQPIQTKET
jgi:hypothetical protein